MKRHLNYSYKKKSVKDEKENQLIKNQGPEGSIKIGKKQYYQDDKNYELLTQIIQQQNLNIPANICILVVYPQISKSVAGRCIKASNELKLFSEFDYIVELSGSLWETLEQKQKYLLLYHQILHIEIDYDKEGNVKFLLKDHNIKDFKQIISKHGIDWIQNISLINSSIYDTDGDVSI